MTLDEYVEACGASTEVEIDEDFSLEEFLAAAEEQMRVLGSIEPPNEVAEWHNAVLASQEDLMDALEDSSDSEGGGLSEEVLFGVVFSLAFEHGQAIEDALSAMDPEVRDQLGAAGCLGDEEFSDFGEEAVPDQPPPAPAETPERLTPVPASAMFVDEYAAACAQYVEGEIAEDATNGEVAAEMALSIEFMESIDPPPELADLHRTILGYGKAIRGIAQVLPQDEVANPFAFLVVLPQLEEIEAAMDDLDPEVRARLAAFGCLGDVDGSGLGLDSPLPAGLPSPSNVTYALEGSAIRVSWDPVGGADYYHVYYDDFFDSNCMLNRDGSPVFCGLLATDVAGTTYLHTVPDKRRNYYWVVACNRGGCSEIDSFNPATPTQSTATPSPSDDIAESRPDASEAVPAATPDRAAFEASTPAGYTAVTLSRNGTVWGVPERYTTDSDTGLVAYVLLAMAKGCTFADDAVARGSRVYIKTRELGQLSDYTSVSACETSTLTWRSSWTGRQIAHLRFFDESEQTNVSEYIYDTDRRAYVGAPAA